MTNSAADHTPPGQPTSVVTQANLPIITDTIELAPNYRLSIGLALLAIVCLVTSLFSPAWLGVILGIGGCLLGLFGVFLLLQTISLRLRFTPTDLDIYRGEKLIRRFPYQDWQNWEIFGASVPILFYFKEIKSIHFLPIIFDPQMLRTCLVQRCPKR
jgi:hypothetical protein